MQTNDETYINAYATLEEQWQSTATNTSEKLNSWRQQLLLLQHLSRNHDDDAHYDIINAHYNKLCDESTLHDDYLNKCATNAVTWLKELRVTEHNDVASNLNPTSVNNEPIDNYPIPAKSTFENICCGIYESCHYNEINSEIFQEYQISQSGLTNVLPQQTHIKPTPVMRNTLGNFLRAEPMRVQPFLNKPSMPVNHAKINATSTATPTTTAKPNENAENETGYGMFRTAREELALQNLKKNQPRSAETRTIQSRDYGAVKKSLGGKRSVRSNFVPPVRANAEVSNTYQAKSSAQNTTNTTTNDSASSHIDPKMIEIIKSEIMHKYKPVAWDDIAGLEYAKSTILEAVVYPLMRPDLFTGLRRPPRGILLFGPPGTGKTLIGKCIASQSNSTFFSINPSTLTSKWVGDGEKLVKALFAVAAEHQPAVVFMDEIDSLLSQRSSTEHESSRRLKNEFLIQLDGASTSDDERILIIGATNRPQELDEAVRRRFVRRLYIPLPDLTARIQILRNLLNTVKNCLSDAEINEIAHLTEGFSGADIDSLCREAAMEPMRAIPAAQLSVFSIDNVRPIALQDFNAALKNVRPSVSQDILKQYTEWNNMYCAGR